MFVALLLAVADPVAVTEVTLHGDMDCFRVATPTATYLLGKAGAGLASLLDPAGRDWVSFKPGGQARGEYRGLPKCGQPAKLFHCGYGFGQYPTANPFASRVTRREPGRVRIDSETADGTSAGCWDFYPTHAVFTLRRIARPTYWFLYEGTPGGGMDPADDFVVRPDGTRTPLGEPWHGSVRWACFGAKECPLGLVVAALQDTEPGATDSHVLWPFERQNDGSFQDMTVFGFGRKGFQELVQHVPDLKRLPARFAVGLVPTADRPTADRLYRRMLAAPAD